MKIGLLLLLVASVLLLLKWQFPYAATEPDDAARIIYLLLLIILIASGRRISRLKGSQTLRYAAIWMAIIMGLVLAYSFRNNVAYNRLIGELVPQRVQVGEEGELSVRSDDNGHFHIEAEVNGVPVNFMIDTGASDIVLSPDDAARAGFDVEALNYNRMYVTANGSVKGAPVRIEELRIGTIVRKDQPASVNGAAMDGSLLGMRFLSSLSSYSVSGNVMTLKP